MNRQKNIRKQFFANKMHREMFFLVFVAAVIPVLIVSVALFYLFFNITAQEVGIPEAIAYTVIPAARKVIMIMLAVTPIIIFAILFYARTITHKIIGPFDRVVRELGECLDGERQGPITLRDGDKFLPLVDLINKLLNK